MTIDRDKAFMTKAMFYLEQGMELSFPVETDRLYRETFRERIGENLRVLANYKGYNVVGYSYRILFDNMK